MTTLIPDARRKLFGGLFDHAALLGPSPPTLADAVEEYRELRGDSLGWTVGRFVVPVSRLEELAGLLVRTMAGGEMPWSLTAVFDGDAAADAALATSVHALLDPAAPIDVVQISVPSSEYHDIEEAVVAATAVHQEVFPMVRLGIDDAVSSVESIAQLGKRLLRPAGVVLAQDDAIADATALTAAVRSLGERGVTFAYDADRVSVLTDSLTGDVGVVNLLAGVGHRSHTDTVRTILADDDSSAFDIGFGGLRWRDRASRSSTRTPLLSIGSRRPGALLGELRLLGLET
ncbi:MAG: hypothetical protein ABFR89_05965 [Actinomycetota bacterium]